MKPVYLASCMILYLAVFAAVIYPQASMVKSDVVNPTPMSLGFEDGTLGKVPNGWISPTASLGYVAELTDVGPKVGSRCALLKSPAGASDGRAFGNLMQAIDAAPYRGHVVRFRAAVRTEGSESFSALWMRIDRRGGRQGFFDNMGDRHITTADWTYFDIVGPVDDDAELLNVGMILIGDGKAWIDDASVTDLGKIEMIVEKARPLSSRGLENVYAFTRLLGYIRHFYPSDEAANANWPMLAVTGMRKIESASGPRELAHKLEDFFKPLAPELKVFLRTSKGNPAVTLTLPANYQALSLVAYRHTGFGQGHSADSTYHTERPAVSIADADEAKVAEMRRPYIADLGGGVSCVFPLAVFSDGKSTLPHGSYKLDLEKDQLVRFTGNDRATRLADVALAWNIFQHFFPYFDVVKINWERELRTTLVAAANDGDELAFETTLRRMVAKLQDGHGRVYIQTADHSSYLPVRFEWIEGHVVVTAVAPKGSDGLKIGDLITEIDGRPAAKAVADIEETISAATPQWKKFAAMEMLSNGAKDSEIHLVVRSDPGSSNAVVLKRSPEYSSLIDPKPEKVTEIRRGIFYLDLDRITDADFNAVLPKLAVAKGIIFDLRGYPRVSPDVISHLIDKPVQSARWMIPIITAPDRTGKIEYDTNGRWDLQPKAPRLTAKVAFLTDGRAISYAESYMGIIEAYKLASIVGETTAGTNGDVNPFKLPGDYSVVWTGMKVLKHDGSQHHGIGIKPTDPVSRTIRGVRAGKDEQLEAAVLLVSK